MHELHELRKNLCKELKTYGKQETISINTLDIVDRLSHAIKNLDKIIAHNEKEGYGDTKVEDSMISELTDMMNRSENSDIREELRRLVKKVEDLR